MKKKFLALSLCFCMVMMSITGCGDKEKNESNDNQSTQEAVDTGNSVDNTTADKEDAADGGESSSINDTPVEGLKGETLDYYWNIDTQDFDKSKFDGQITFYGNVIEGKITGDKLQAAGIEIENYGATSLNTTTDEDYWYFTSPKFIQDGEKIELSSNESIYPPGIINFTNDEIYSENSIIVPGYAWGGFNWGLLNYNIYPTMLGIEDTSDITIDLVLEKLGAPTYVRDRTDKTMGEGDRYGYTIYVYVYDDVAFLFAFYNDRDLKLASNFYYPIENLNYAGDDGRTSIDRLEDQYQKYLSTK